MRMENIRFLIIEEGEKIASDEQYSSKLRILYEKLSVFRSKVRHLYIYIYIYMWGYAKMRCDYNFDSDLLAVEDANSAWKNSRMTLVSDYYSIYDLDQGFVETCILFDLPKRDSCSAEFTKIINLSSKMKRSRRIVIMLDPKKDLWLSHNVIQLLNQYNKPVPRFLHEMFLEASRIARQQIKLKTGAL
uniref:NR LBD domain-containing protein n=1 Tax=Heterorhabditis bacteriophora TaxID=37862 RepID=A0A1I7XMP4_HETBA